MKLMKKFIVLMNMLFVGLSLQTVHSANPAMNTGVAEVAKAAGSSAKLKFGYDLREDMDSSSVASNVQYFHSQIQTIVITSNPNYVKSGYIAGCPIDVGSESTQKTNGCHIAAYFYPRLDDATKYDAVFYANVDKIHAPDICSSLFYSWRMESIHFDNFDTSNVTNMTNMFGVCSNLKEIKGLESLDTSNVTEMDGMFSFCASLTSLDLRTFNTSKVTDVDKMFRGCTRLEELDLSGMDLSKVTTGLDTMFYEVTNSRTELKVIYAPKEMGNNVLRLPSYFTTEAANATLNSSTENKVILCSNTKYTDPNAPTKSYTISDLANEIMKLNTCTDYNQAAYLFEKYDALSLEDKAIFDMVKSHADNATLTDKLTYMVSLYNATSSDLPLLSHSNITAKQGRYALVAIIAFSIITILGYQFIQKKKYAK